MKEWGIEKNKISKSIKRWRKNSFIQSFNWSIDPSAQLSLKIPIVESEIFVATGRSTNVVVNLIEQVRKFWARKTKEMDFIEQAFYPFQNSHQIHWHLLNCFKNAPFPVSFFFIFVFSTENMIIIKFCRWLVSSRGPPVSEATALPTESQPLPIAM